MADEIFYSEGAIFRLAAKHGATVMLQPHMSTPKVVKEFGKNYLYGIYDIYYENLCKELNRINDIDTNSDLSRLVYNGNRFESQEAFGMKKNELTREDIIKSLGLNRNKKNVVIYLHCLSDACYNLGGSFYRDYYCWYEDTLKKIQNIDNINWIIRDHPMSGVYGDRNILRATYEKYKKDNIYWMSNKINGKSIPQIADVMITMNGTAGMELTALGIPCIVLGKPYYSHFGYTINIKSEEEYIEILSKVDKIDKLTDEQIKKARKVLFVYSNYVMNRYDTEIEKMMTEYRNEVYNNVPNIVAERKFMNKLIEWLDKNDIYESRIYKLGYDLRE